MLNHNLDVLGFGGVIGLGESDPKVVDSPRELKNAMTGDIHDDSEIASLGLGRGIEAPFASVRLMPICWYFSSRKIETCECFSGTTSSSMASSALMLGLMIWMLSNS